MGVLVYRHDKLLYANRHFLEWSGYDDLAAIEAAGGLGRLFAEPAADALADDSGRRTAVRQIGIDHDAARRQDGTGRPHVYGAVERSVGAGADCF